MRRRASIRLLERGKQLKYLSFTILQLGGALKEHSFESGSEELSLDFYSGPVRVEADGWSVDIAARESISQPGPMVYIPAGRKVRIARLDGDARVTVAGALGKAGGSPAVIPGGDAMKNLVGKDNWSRTVFTHIANNLDAAHLIAGETVNRPGGWSSCPPHKHDRFAPPAEVPMEEVYYFQVEPKQGFGFMRVYSGSRGPRSLRSCLRSGARRHCADPARVPSGGRMPRLHSELHLGSCRRGTHLRRLDRRSAAFLDQGYEFKTFAL